MADPDIDNLGARLRDSIGDLGSNISSGLDRLAALLIPAAQAARPPIPSSVPKPTTTPPGTPSTNPPTQTGKPNQNPSSDKVDNAGSLSEDLKKRIEGVINAFIEGFRESTTNFKNITALLGPSLTTKSAVLLFEELDRTGKEFREISRVGAVFGGGLTELRERANMAGLNLAQFSKALKENSEALASTGLSVPEAARRMSGALYASGKELASELVRLGYDFDEFGGLVAETMSLMRTAGAPLRATDEQIAQETRKYAENLRVISAITGEDAKKRMNEAKEAAKQLAFQQKIAGLGAEQQAAIMRAMVNMSPLMQKAVMEQVVFGGMVSKVTAATGSMIPAFGEVVKQAGDLATAGQLDEERFRDLMKDRGATLEQEMRTLSGVPEAAMLGVGGIISELGPALNGLYDYAKKFSPEAIDAAEKNIKDLKASKDVLTTSYVDLSRAVQSFKIIIEGSLTESLKNFGNTVNNVITRIGEIIKDPKGHIDKVLNTEARATGGPVLENMVYQVGELGPELFVPSTNGTIISNDRVRNMLSRPSSDLTNTIESMQNSIANAVSLAISKPGTVQIDAETKQLLREQLAIQKQHVTALSNMQRVLDDMRGQDQRYYSYSA